MDREYIIPGRARTPEQKREIIERLYNVWAGPGEFLRLGQFLYNAMYGKDCFATEDEAFIEMLESHFEQ